MSRSSGNELAQMLVDAADRTFSEVSDALVAGYDEKAWLAVEAAGLDRILLTEEQGGAGDAFDAALLVAGRFGARGGALPFVETLVANRCLANAGIEVTPGPKTILLPAESGRVAWAIEGIAVIRPGGALLTADAGALLPEVRTNLAGEPARLLSSEWAAQCDVLPSAGELGLYAAAKAAAIVGALQVALEMTIRHVNERVQFGRKLGAFQAIQHMVACMAEEVAAAAASVQLAGRSLDGHNALYFAAVAKSRAGEAATRVCAMAHQCHGAIGYTCEYPLHRYTARALAWRDDAGSEQYWNDRIGRAALAPTAPELWPLLLEGAQL